MPKQLPDLASVFSSFVSAAIGFFGIVMFVIIIVGGFGFLNSGGEANKVKAAQKTLTSGIVGFVLALAGYFILVIFEKITGVKVTIFNLTI
jgi:hypothetical protein